MSMMCDLYLREESSMTPRSLMEEQCGTMELDRIKVFGLFSCPIVKWKYLLLEIYSCHLADQVWMWSR